MDLLTEMDMKAYEGILRQTSQPTNIANIPSKQRKEIEEGFALLKQIKHRYHP